MIFVIKDTLPSTYIRLVCIHIIPFWTWNPLISNQSIGLKGMFSTQGQVLISKIVFRTEIFADFCIDKLFFLTIRFSFFQQSAIIFKIWCWRQNSKIGDPSHQLAYSFEKSWKSGLVSIFRCVNYTSIIKTDRVEIIFDSFERVRAEISLAVG